MRDYVHVKQCDVITYTCRNFNAGLDEKQQKLGHG